jgi:hypothetical protein
LLRFPVLPLDPRQESRLFFVEIPMKWTS